MNGAPVVFKGRTGAGRNSCSASPGTAERPLVYGIGMTTGQRAVPCLPENTVSGAVDGYALMAGQPIFARFHLRAA
jgi:hypothetical protein